MKPLAVLPVAAIGSVCFGYLIAYNPQAAFTLLLAIALLGALSLPASNLVLIALCATLTFKALVTFGLLPPMATFADMFFVWAALAAALIGGALRNRTITRLRTLVVALAAVALVSSVLNRTEFARPLVYFALLGLPFAVVLALLIEPPTKSQRRALRLTLGVLLLAQIPITGVQFFQHGLGDGIQGSLVGAGAGAHVISAIAVVGALWLAFDTSITRYRWVWILALAAIPFVADAKQVILATPAMILAGRWRGLPDVAIRTGAVVVAVVGLLTIIPAGDSAAFFLERAQTGRGGKQETARLVVNSIRSDAASTAFGLGPAESVSRAAFMTTPLLLHAESPLNFLGLSPARLAANAQLAATTASGGGTSFDSGISSALGVLGDLGLFGMGLYLGILATIYGALRRMKGASATAATCALALFAVLGLVFDWWEQPPFSIVVGIIVGLALTEPVRARR